MRASCMVADRAFLLRVAVPAASVLGALLLMGIAAFAALAGLPDSARDGLFAAGVIAWMVGILWAVLAQARRPAPHRANRR